MPIVLISLHTIMLISIASVLLFKYKRTAERGFLWLTIPLVVLPILTYFQHGWIQSVIGTLQSEEKTGYFPISLIDAGQISIPEFLGIVQLLNLAIWTIFVVVGLSLIGRPKTSEGDYSKRNTTKPSNATSKSAPGAASSSHALTLGVNNGITRRRIG